MRGRLGMAAVIAVAALGGLGLGLLLGGSGGSGSEGGLQTVAADQVVHVDAGGFSRSVNVPDLAQKPQPASTTQPVATPVAPAPTPVAPAPAPTTTTTDRTIAP